MSIVKNILAGDSRSSLVSPHMTTVTRIKFGCFVSVVPLSVEWMAMFLERLTRKDLHDNQPCADPYNK